MQTMRDLMQFMDSSYSTIESRSKGILRFRSLSLLDRSLRSVAIATIAAYQCHLSPRKGYSCAHRIVHGGHSCSESIKNILTDKSLFEATLLARQRFRECNIASMSINNRVAKSGNSTKALMGGPDSDPISCLIGLVIAFIAALFGKDNCCK
jgi:putative component of membrane protein insertase Oxa1/YidC/SpoIIIJ protein YidD